MFKRASIKLKMGIAFIIVIAIFIGVSITSFKNINRLVDANNEDKQSWEVIALADEIGRMPMTFANSLQQINPDQSGQELMDQTKQQFQQKVAQLQKLTSDSSEQQQLIQSAAAIGEEQFAKAEAVIHNNPEADGTTLSQLVHAATMPNIVISQEDSVNRQDMISYVEQIKEIEQNHLKDRESVSDKLTNITFASLLGGTLVAAVISLFIYILLTRPIVRNIRNTTDMLKDIAEGDGDLTKRLEITSQDEIGEMAMWFNSFIDKMRELISDVVHNAQALHESNQEVSAAIEQSNQSMNEVAITTDHANESIQTSASASEEALASIQEVASQARMIFAQAEQAKENGDKVLEAASQGEVVVSDAVQAIATAKDSSSEVLEVIGGLKSSTDEIGKIVGMITSITEQTSLLSLNASIEAARAGDAGRGFAVVANEVKKLAEESKKSAQQIDSIVSDIQQKMGATDAIITKEQALINTSSDKVLQTSEEFSNIMFYIKAMSKKIKAMTDASLQQSNIANEMTKAITVLSEGLQENASASQQISASIQSQADIYKEIEQNMDNIQHISEILKLKTERFRM